MKKIYIVTAGSYSDYSINAVFDTREMAQQYINLHGDGNSYFNIEEWELNKVENFLKQGKKPFIVTFDKDGNTNVKNASPDIIHGLFSVYTLLQISVWARDENHAIKSASDLRRKGLAQNKFEFDKFGYRKIGNDYTDNVIK